MVMGNLTARFHAARDVRLAEEPAPVPAAGESLVRITAVGLCGSDLHWYDEGGIGDSRITDPIVGGHEMAGVVEGGPLDGVRVAVDPAIPCHHCDLCLQGHPNLCRKIIFAGHTTRDGGLQRYLAWPTARLYPLPEALSDADGAMLEPLGVAVHADHLAEFTSGQGVDVAFEIAGTDPAIAAAMDAVRPGGRVVLAGIPSAETSAFPASVARRKGLTIMLVRRMKEVYPRATALVQAGLVDVRGVVSHRFPLTEVDDAFKAAVARQGLKVIVAP
jgi:L-iditol 2-dehydrogenase